MVAVLAALQAGARMTGADLRRACGLPRRTVYEALRRLRERGVLRQRGSLHDSRQTYFWLAEAEPALAPGGASGPSLAEAPAAGPGAHGPSEPAVSAP
jgi:biotin operon repressor